MKPEYSTPLRGNLRINVDEIYEVRHWAKQLGVSIQQLRAAIEQVGPLVDAVRQHLKDEIDPDNPWYPRPEQSQANR
jgi:hypothetical protein